MNVCADCLNWKPRRWRGAAFGFCREYGEETNQGSTCIRFTDKNPHDHVCPARRALAYLSTPARLQAAERAHQAGDTVGEILLLRQEYTPSKPEVLT